MPAGRDRIRNDTLAAAELNPWRATLLPPATARNRWRSCCDEGFARAGAFAVDGMAARQRITTWAKGQVEVGSAP